MSLSPAGNEAYLGQSMRLMINDPSGVSQARQAGSLAAKQHGLSEELAGRVALVISEAATNIARHARSGMVVLRRLTEKSGRGMEVIALDKGPGMENVAKCMEDGYSTAGTHGTGLGAMKRMSGVFDIHSRPGVGTAVLSQVWDNGIGGKGPGVMCGAVCVPMGSERLCGDAWMTRARGDVLRVMVADGLGHGPMANEAAMEAVRIFSEQDEEELPRLMELIHGALKKTRGAAVALAALDQGRGEVRFAGVGNIAGTVIHEGKSKSMVSSNGTVGHQLHRVNEFVYPWLNGAVMVLNSDGVASQWSLAKYGALATRHPGLLAGVLLRDFSRERDDTTVLTVSNN